MMSEETKDPARTIPKALILAFIITFVLYMGIGFAEVSILDWRVLGLSASPLSELANAVSNYSPFLDLISISALIATSSVVLSSLIGGSRASFAMGRDNLLPSFFDKVSKKRGTPYVSILVGGGIIIGLAGLFYDRIDAIASIVNFGSLFTYLFVHLSLLKLRRSEEKSERLFKVPFYPLLPIVGALSCILMMNYLDFNAKIASIIWFLIGLVVYSIMKNRMKAKS
jgi:APA family basic amino acid/polyamine antiporter